MGNTYCCCCDSSSTIQRSPRYKSCSSSVWSHGQDSSTTQHMNSRGQPRHHHQLYNNNSYPLSVAAAAVDCCCSCCFPSTVAPADEDAADDTCGEVAAAPYNGCRCHGGDDTGADHMLTRLEHLLEQHCRQYQGRTEQQAGDDNGATIAAQLEGELQLLQQYLTRSRLLLQQHQLCVSSLRPRSASAPSTVVPSTILSPVPPPPQPETITSNTPRCSVVSSHHSNDEAAVVSNSDVITPHTTTTINSDEHWLKCCDVNVVPCGAGIVVVSTQPLTTTPLTGLLESHLDVSSASVVTTVPSPQVITTSSPQGVSSEGSSTALPLLLHTSAAAAAVPVTCSVGVQATSTCFRHPSGGIAELTTLQQHGTTPSAAFMLQVSSERSDDEDSSSDGGGDGGGSQEEEEEDSPVHCATEPSTALYAPKPAYDQLEVYSVSDAGTAAAVGGGGATLKQRRSGLSALHQSQILAEHAADEEPVVQAVLTIQPVTSQSATVRSLTSTVAASTPTITVTSSTSEPVNVNVSSAAASNKQDVGSMPWPELPTSPTLHRLQEAGLLNKGPIDKLSTTELEAVFRRVELVLKIDRVTLPDRLEVLRKQRDTAHANYYRELAAVNGHMATIDEECMKGDLATEVEQLKKCLQVLAVAVESVVSAAQAWSGVQHEWSFSRTAEVLQTFTDHCLQQYNDANKQIKHLTTLVNTIPPATPVPGSPGGPRQRATSLNPPQEGRRLSLSPVPRGGADSSSPKVGRSFSSIVTAAAAARRSSLSPNLKPFDEASRMALGNLRVQSIKEEVNSRMTSKSFSSNSGNESSSSACESSARDVSLASRNDKSDVSSGSAAVNNSEHSLDTNSTISGDNSNTVSPSSTVSRLHTYYEEASQLPLSNEQHHHLYESLHEEDDDSDDELLQELLEYERVRAAREAAHRSVMMSRPPPGYLLPACL